MSFTPDDSTDFTSASGSTTLTVNMATPTINWTTPSPITYGTPLSSTQLNATASALVNGQTVNVTGTFTYWQEIGRWDYTPVANSVLGAGNQTLQVRFTPDDDADFTSATGNTTLTVNQATPTINWTTPSPIAYGTPLSSTQLTPPPALGQRPDGQRHGNIHLYASGQHSPRRRQPRRSR